MIYETQTKVGRIVPGRLECSIDGHEDMYVEDSPAYDLAYQAFDLAGDVMRDDRISNMLPTFRKLVSEHKASFPNEVVTKCYMNYRDAEFLYRAYKKELEAQETNLRGCDSDFFCDGIQVKKGCDNEQAKVTIHSSKVSDDKST